jgi:hypothetical protein
MMKAGQMIFDGSRELTKVFLWRNNEGLLEGFQGFVQKTNLMKNGDLRVERVLCSWLLQNCLGFCAENPLIYHCLTILNQCLSLLSSKEGNYTFANLVKCIVEV